MNKNTNIPVSISITKIIDENNLKVSIIDLL